MPDNDGLSRRDLLKTSAVGAAGVAGASSLLAAPAAADETHDPGRRHGSGKRQRLRDLGVVIGTLPTGRHNALTDVLGVQVGYKTLIFDKPGIARTGVTIIVPRRDPMWENYCYAGFYSHNGNGAMTGTHWIEEVGWLTSMIGITNTHQVGIVRDTLIKLESEHNPDLEWRLPVVAETWDGPLNDMDRFWVTEQDVRDAVHDAGGGLPDEGNVGGGTGMSYFGFKGGSGTSSRVVKYAGHHYTVGVFVQSNYGRREYLRVNGASVGLEIPTSKVPADGPPVSTDGGGSCIIIVATDAPMLPGQCKRLATRAGIGLADTGGYAGNGSGDLYLAFSTGNDIRRDDRHFYTARSVSNDHIDDFFVAVDEATQEALHNSATMARTMRGYQTTRHAIPLDDLVRSV